MSFHNNFICDQRAEEVLGLIKEILGDDLVELQVINLRFSENFETSAAQFEAMLVERVNEKLMERNISGNGVGLMDACFDAMSKCYEKDYWSLNSIAIVDFRLDANIDRGTRRQSDANVTGILRVKNADDHEYAFECTTSSISHSSVSAVQACIAFFINAEVAFKVIYRALNDAKERGRHDLVDRYKSHMATLVHATNYEKIVTALREQK